MSREGLAALSTNRVAEKAGVSIGSLYQYFPGKEALVTALVEVEAQKIAAILTEHAGDANAPVPVRVRGLVRGLIACHRGDPVLHSVLVAFGKQLGPSSPFAVIEATSIALVEFQLRQQTGLHITDPGLAAFLLFYAVEGVLEAVTNQRQALLVEGSPLEDEICSIILRYLGL